MMRGALLLLLVCVSTAGAQSISTGISRDTIRVGDPLRVLVRIEGLPAGAEVMLPDTLTPNADVENAGRARIVRDTTAGGAARVTAAYPVIAWRPGELLLDSLSFVVRANGVDRTVRAALPQLNVSSVLPADTTNIQAKPPKDVWGGNRVWWPWLLAGALLLALGALAWWWYRRRRRQTVAAPAVLFVDPREHALAELARLREQRLIERGELKLHYILLAETLRGFAAALESDWSTDLTTEELAPRLQRNRDTGVLLELLRAADTVKFARRQASAAEAQRDLDAAATWVESFNRRAETAEAA